MAFHPDDFHRHGMRWRARDYSLAGTYFVTVVADSRRCLLGTISRDVMHLNDAGRMVTECWESIASRFDGTRTGEFIVMPNHVHGVLVVETRSQDSLLVPERSQEPAPDSEPARRRNLSTQLLGKMMAYFKSETTRQYARGVRAHNWPQFRHRLWQRNYFDRVIRDEREAERIGEYIRSNPARWTRDRENPDFRGAPTGG